jgi:hypothetical protein
MLLMLISFNEKSRYTPTMQRLCMWVMVMSGSCPYGLLVTVFITASSVSHSSGYMASSKPCILNS